MQTINSEKNFKFTITFFAKWTSVMQQEASIFPFFILHATYANKLLFLTSASISGRSRYHAESATPRIFPFTPILVIISWRRSMFMRTPVPPALLPVRRMELASLIPLWAMRCRMTSSMITDPMKLIDAKWRLDEKMRISYEKGGFVQNTVDIWMAIINENMVLYRIL